MQPRLFNENDITFARNVLTAMMRHYTEDAKGYDLSIDAEPDSDTIEVGGNYCITSELEPVPCLLPREEWREQQVYRVHAIWGEYSYEDGYADTGYKDLGTVQSLGAALTTIFLDIVENNLRQIREGVDWPETTPAEHI